MNSRSKKWGIAGLAGFLVVGAAMAATTEFVDDVVISTAKTTVPVLTAHGLGGVVFTGTWGTGGIPAEGEGTRFMWHPRRAAIRAGRVSGTQWDADFMGSHSAAFGYDATASGPSSFAAGTTTTASGSRAVAIGDGTTASGMYAVATGFQTVASGTSSLAGGYESAATANHSLAFGFSSTASGIYSTAIGRSVASGHYGFATSRSTVTAEYASGFGLSQSSSYFGMTIGRYNTVEGTLDAWVATDPIFVIGNGTSSSNRSNAFVVRKNGNVEMKGDVQIDGKVTLPRQGDVLMGEFGN